MSGEPCELTDLKTALERFAFPSGGTQGSGHIIPLHWYVACRLVIEGGFDPDWIVPRPPFTIKTVGQRRILHHEPGAGGSGERTLFGGLKTKDMDVTVCVDGVGPVLAVSMKGTQNAFRNLTNRMEEAAGDCTNLHLAYPALVYGFWHVLRANVEGDTPLSAPFELDDNGRFKTADVAISETGTLAPGVGRYALALERLSERDDLRDSPSRYEACGLTLVGCEDGHRGRPHPVFPKAGQVLDMEVMFDRLYKLYDQRFVFQAPALSKQTTRYEWDPTSPILAHTVLTGGAFAEMTPRLAE